MLNYIVIAVVAYLIGSISFSIIFTKKFAGFDVREKGSGNAGSTNVLRTAGKIPALLTLICDTLKGVVAVAIGLLIGEMVKADANTRAILVEIAGAFVIIGHTFPIFFGFKGGKGVATSLGILLMTNWQLGLICLVFALVLMALTRVVSMGSIAAAILYPILTLFVGGGHYIVESSGLGNGYFIYSVILAVIVIFNHRENIKRILSGTENKISFNK